MIGEAIDRLVGVFNPLSGVRRQQARRVIARGYEGAKPNRLTASRTPVNRSADSEMIGIGGADQMRAWARQLVRDNAYAWGVIDTIVSSVVGNGIKTMSTAENPDGSDKQETNEARDEVWEDWCEVCDVNGQYTFAEIQELAQREMVEAGECLVHYITTPKLKHRGITRPVPLALELIEADRLASDRDTYTQSRRSGNRIVRGVELDDLGKPVAYWVYPEHPTAPGVLRQEPVRLQAKNVRHLYRRDRIGQSRGVSWFAPVLTWLRDLGFYVDNELQASAVASCFTVAITHEDPPTADGVLAGEDAQDSTDANGNQYDNLEPGTIMHLGPGESISSENPGRPNSSAEPWINLMLRGIATGTGLSFETVARDYSKTTYSANRASQLEDRRRFRRWQQYLCRNLCQPTWDRFTEAAAIAGLDNFPSMVELLNNRRKAAPVNHQATGWEWVDPTKEQQASAASIDALQSTYQDEAGIRGRSWRKVMRQRAKEERLIKELDLKPNLAGGTLPAEPTDGPTGKEAEPDNIAKEAESEDEKEEAITSA